MQQTIGTSGHKVSSFAPVKPEATIPKLPEAPSPAINGSVILHGARHWRGDVKGERLVMDAAGMADRLRQHAAEMIERARTIYSDESVSVTARHHNVRVMAARLWEPPSQQADAAGAAIRKEIERVNAEMDSEVRRVPTDPNAVQIAAEIRRRAFGMDDTKVALWASAAARRGDWLVSAALLSAPVELWGKKPDAAKLVREAVQDARFPGQRERVAMLEAVLDNLTRAHAAYVSLATQGALYDAAVAKQGADAAARAQRARDAAAGAMAGAT